MCVYVCRLHIKHFYVPDWELLFKNIHFTRTTKTDFMKWKRKESFFFVLLFSIDCVYSNNSIQYSHDHWDVCFIFLPSSGKMKKEFSHWMHFYSRTFHLVVPPPMLSDCLIRWRSILVLQAVCYSLTFTYTHIYTHCDWILCDAEKKIECVYMPKEW